MGDGEEEVSEMEREGEAIPVKGPCESKMVVATLFVVRSALNCWRVTTAMASKTIPPTTKSASRPRKAKKTAFGISGPTGIEMARKPACPTSG
jgi:hypothetical protein